MFQTLLGASGLYVTEINYATGRVKLSDYTLWGALNKRDIKVGFALLRNLETGFSNSL